MFVLEKIIFQSPISAARPSCWEYVITKNGEVLFGAYSDAMQKFYDIADEITFIKQSEDLDNLMPLFKQCYYPLLNEQYERLVQQKYRLKCEQKTHGFKVAKYDASRYYYIQYPEDRTHLSNQHRNTIAFGPSRSLFFSFIKNERLPNGNENILFVRSFIDKLCDQIENNHSYPILVNEDEDEWYVRLH